MVSHLSYRPRQVRATNRAASIHCWLPAPFVPQSSFLFFSFYV
jgi:hypothetical protein